MWWIVLIVIAVVAIGLAAGMMVDGKSRNEAANLTFASLSFSNLKDGIYTGAFEGTKSHLRDTQVQVAVEKGMISGIKIVKGAIDKNGEPVKLTKGQGVDELFARAIAARSFDVDVISGATITSKTHLKALEQALLQAQ